MNNFPQTWIQDICNELNSAGFTMPDYKGGGRWDINQIENSIDLMKSYVAYSSSIYEHLNSKGLINRGYCPITGEEISNQYSYQMFGRKVYISQRGQQLCEEWDRQEHIKLFGKEPLTKEEKQENYEKFMAEKSENKKGRIMVILLIIISIMLIIKNC